MNCADCKHDLIPNESVKVTYNIPAEFELVKGAEFAYLCNSCYNNGSEDNPNLWKNSQRELEEL